MLQYLTFSLCCYIHWVTQCSSHYTMEFLPFMETPKFTCTILAHPEFNLWVGWHLCKSTVISQWKHHKELWMCRAVIQGIIEVSCREDVILSNNLTEYKRRYERFSVFPVFVAGMAGSLLCWSTQPTAPFAFQRFHFHMLWLSARVI